MLRKNLVVFLSLAMVVGMIPLGGVVPLIAGEGREFVSFEATNGFNIQISRPADSNRGVQRYYFTYESPWGERMEVEAKVSKTRMTFLFGAHLGVEVKLDPKSGEPVSFTTWDQEGRQHTDHSAGRARRVALGLEVHPNEINTKPYEIIAANLKEWYSEDFLSGMAEMEDSLAMPAGCGWDFTLCAAGVAGYLLSFAGLAAACGTLSPACVFAILAHDSAILGAVGSCTHWYTSCN